MNKEEAVDLILDYLDTLKIKHSEPEEDDENNIEILFVTEGKDSPGGFIESAITFSENCLLARAYFNTLGQKLVTTNLERFPALFRLLNFINEEKNHISIQQQSPSFDDDEERSAIFCPQLRMTEDGNHDIKYQVIVDYPYLELFPNETSQMVVVFLQLYLNSVAPAVFGVLTGEMNLYEAKNTVTNADKKMEFPENYLPTEEDDE
ncbi:MAG: hypothetical protein ACLTDA_09330 [[Eubacterium] siraeum]|jgi:hypothetical protein